MVKSHRAGVGKTLKTKRLYEALLNSLVDETDDSTSLVTIAIHSRNVNDSDVLETLLTHCTEPGHEVARIFHFNIAPEVQMFLSLEVCYYLKSLAFSLLICIFS